MCVLNELSALRQTHIYFVFPCVQFSFVCCCFHFVMHAAWPITISKSNEFIVCSHDLQLSNCIFDLLKDTTSEPIIDLDLAFLCFILLSRISHIFEYPRHHSPGISESHSIFIAYFDSRRSYGARRTHSDAWKYHKFRVSLYNSNLWWVPFMYCTVGIH